MTSPAGPPINPVAAVTTPARTYPASGSTSWKPGLEAAIESGVASADGARARAQQTAFYATNGMRRAHVFDFADRPLIKLRFDDDDPTNATLADNLWQLGLVASFAIIANPVDTNNTQLTSAQILKMQAQGHQIMCHSYYHHDGPNTVPNSDYPPTMSIEDQMYKEFIGAKALLQSKNFWAEEWIQPGTWTTGSGQNQGAYPPFLGGIANQAFFEQTELGRLIQSEFNGISTYTNDGWGVQSGYGTRPHLRPYGKSNYGLGGRPIADMKALVDQAIAGGGQQQFLSHAGTGFMASDFIPQLLPYLRAQVDAGLCYVVTESFGSMAQQGTPKNLLNDQLFVQLKRIGTTESWTMNTHRSDNGNSFKNVAPPTSGPDPSKNMQPGDRPLYLNGDGSVTALSINPGSNANSDFQLGTGLALRSLRAVCWAKGDGGASQLNASTVYSGGGGITISKPTYTLAADTWTRIEWTFGTHVQTTGVKPIWAVPSSATNPALITSPVITPT